jgi:NADH-quinone oxidoreductase subunit L
MVTAGVYMIGRNAVLFSHAEVTLAVVAIVGVATALMAATIGLVQHDIKRVLAYSTISQLGFMFLAMGAGAWAAGIFHLYTHAFFKALLFLGAGAVIHALAGEQDLRRMGGLRGALPITYWTFLVGALAIAGVPLLSGFFSKDEILYRTWTAGHPILWILAVATSLLTAVYMFRVVFLAFHGERRAGTDVEHVHGHGSAGGAHEAPPSMAVPLVVLAIGSVLAGYAGVPHVLGGANWIEGFLEPSFTAAGETGAGAAHAAAPGGESIEATLMAVSVAAAFAGIGLAFFFFLRRPDAAGALALRFHEVRLVLLGKYYVDEIYDAAIVQPIKRISTVALWRGVDAGFIDGAVNGTGTLVRGWSAILRRLQTGSVRAYAASLFLGVVMIVGYYLWK